MRCSAIPVVVCLLSVLFSVTAQASGTPSLAVQELAVKAVDNPGPYLLAINRRGPMLATCYGSREAMEASKPFEVFIEVGTDGVPAMVNLQAIRGATTAETDGCLLSQLNKARFPEAGKAVELRATMGPAPSEDDAQ